MPERIKSVKSMKFNSYDLIKIEQIFITIFPLMKFEGQHGSKHVYLGVQLSTH